MNLGREKREDHGILGVRVEGSAKKPKSYPEHSLRFRIVKNSVSQHPKPEPEVVKSMFRKPIFDESLITVCAFVPPRPLQAFLARRE